jgi:hypothetical protein
MFLCIKPFLIFSVLADLGLHVMLANIEHWQFSWLIAITLLLDSLVFYFLIKDKHTQMMLLDWKKSSQISPEVKP